MNSIKQMRNGKAMCVCVCVCVHISSAKLRNEF